MSDNGREMFHIIGQEQHEDPAEFEYNLDVNHVNLLHAPEIRRTVSGPENTAILLLPPKGCAYGCDFCGVRDIANPSFPVLGDEGVAASRQIAAEVDGVLSANPGVRTLKLFNAGNTLYGTERKASAEINEALWAELVEKLSQHPEVRALELEVRIDEFVGDAENKTGGKTPKGILRDRALWLRDELKKIDVGLRLILPLEYIESSIISDQAKFSPKFSRDSRESCDQAIKFMKEQDIKWLSYAMLGGRLKTEPLTAEEAVSSAAHTVLYGLEQDAREVVINSQYLTPRNQQEQIKDGIPYFVPREADMRETLRLVVLGLQKGLDEGRVSLVDGARPRVRLTTDKEDTIKGTIGPDISQEFRELVLEFNNAPDQIEFYNKRII